MQNGRVRAVVARAAGLLAREFPVVKTVPDETCRFNVTISSDRPCKPAMLAAALSTALRAASADALACPRDEYGDVQTEAIGPLRLAQAFDPVRSLWVYRADVMYQVAK